MRIDRKDGVTTLYENGKDITKYDFIHILVAKYFNAELSDIKLRVIKDYMIDIQYKNTEHLINLTTLPNLTTLTNVEQFQEKVIEYCKLLEDKIGEDFSINISF